LVTVFGSWTDEGYALADQSDGDQPRKPASDPESDPGLGIVHYIKSKFDAYKAKKEAEAPADKAARRTANATIWIAAFTVILAVVSYFQLRELHSGGADTHDLASAAQEQARAAKVTAEEAKDQVGKMGESLKKTDALISQQSDQVKATQNLADQAERSADTAERALKASLESANQDRRPWVSVQMIKCTNCANQADGVVRIGGFTGVLVNTGRTPAVNMAIENDFIETRRKCGIPSYPLPEHPCNGQILASSNPQKDVVLAPNSALPIVYPMSFAPSVDDLHDPGMGWNDRTILYGLVRITYYDTSRKVPYVTTSCVMNQGGGDFFNCPTGNDMK
jgi:hypothetical protein